MFFKANHTLMPNSHLPIYMELTLVILASRGLLLFMSVPSTVYLITQYFPALLCIIDVRACVYVSQQLINRMCVKVSVISHTSLSLPV